MERKPTYIRRRLNSFGYALQGMASAFRSEENLQWHVLSAVVAVAVGFFLGISRIEWAFIIFAIGLVWTAELFNTALEVLVNLVSPGRHPLAGKVKDIAAGAVLVAAITAALIGALVFFPYLWTLLLKSS
ncbi:DeoR faimly transcriptional regulator [Rufibacter radiotolerans]|uniref:DeoR faimly transcriptional regulator n=1 Tax=Rufibacter radiotolerans TaxID=1379910 RepID=A0A0H4VTF6_9BACT|nr:diacylglycerol kinase family protein [Rufibacter radiotolerans]AKQ47074.1 DeoR faimly transcriptional regulator [Rufibacter radiotolerans]